GQFEDLAVGETATDSFTYTVSDGNGGTDTATVTITINGVNDAPTTNDDANVGFTTNEDTSFTTGNVLGNDTDPDTNDTLTVLSIDTTGTQGIVTNNNDGTFDYDPNGQFESLAAGETATDTFTYTVDDGNGGTDTATVTITINGVNDISGFSDEDVVQGGTGNDTLNGGSSPDFLDGGLGNDLLSGGSNADQLIGGEGNDFLNGGSGNDKLDGGNGQDVLNGGSDNDTLTGGDGNDILIGVRGNDILLGGFGQDTLIGGKGSDTFIYQSPDDFGDIITDFEIVADRLDFSEMFNGSGSLGSTVQVRQQGLHTLVQASSGGNMQTVGLLLNVNANTLTDRHFNL
ncbi:Ig-like domain-containing protein, partial [Acaryochloris sp. IP29b_bin.148]|uniref:Ig-like domain-containing protein n=1 Tax=Acaryochloris sp. IP29b_bin.148 TaxID=2969218 RepID=UPI0026256CB2